MQSNMPLNLRRPLATMAKLLSWVCSNSFALSIGATIVCTTPPIKAPATRSRWKFFTPQFNAFSCPSFNLFPSESSSSALILRFLATSSASHKLCSKGNTPINFICFYLTENPIRSNLFHFGTELIRLRNCVNFVAVREKAK